MTLRHVVDVDDVHSGLDIGRHASGKEVADDRARRRRLHVAAAHRERGIDDDRVDPVARRLAHERLGLPLALLVRSGGRAVRHRALVGKLAVAHAAHGRDAGGVDEPGTGRAGGGEDVTRPAYIDGEHRRGRLGERIHRAGVVDGLASLGGLAHGLRVAEIAADDLHLRELGEVGARPWTQEHPHVIAAAQECLRNRAADEAARPRNERFHARTFQSRRIASSKCAARSPKFDPKER